MDVTERTGRTPHLLRLARAAAVAAVLTVGCTAIPDFAPGLSRSVAFADGPAPCSSGAPPTAYSGFCATYAGRNTWYGTYGPGFPTAQGWALCANVPASGESYPSPSYGYSAGPAPVGAGGDWNALGFALSEAQANGDWSGQSGRFTKDQAAAAAKLLYDQAVWGLPTGSLDPGVAAAYDVFLSWFNQARGMSASPPQLSVGLIGGGTVFIGSATDDIHLQFPGTGSPLVGQPLLLSIVNGTFNSPNGPSTIGVATDANGNVLASIYATGNGPVAVTVNTSVGVGQPGLGFYHQSSGPPGAQVIAGFPVPAALSASQALVGQNTLALPQGTVSIEKTGNDTAYYDLAGATFDILSGSTLVAVLVTDASGASSPSTQLDPGTYTVHEAAAPFGYELAPDQSVTVSALQNTVVSYAGPTEEMIAPATLSIHKTDVETGTALAGAQFDVKYSTANNGIFDEDLGSCTTTATGSCSPNGNDGTNLLPGTYQISELDPPPGYFLDPADAVQTARLLPGQATSVNFADEILGSLNLTKTGDDPAYYSVVGAAFAVTGPAPSASQVGLLTVGANGTTNTLSGLLPGTYTASEVTAPPGYQAIQPVNVTVAVGHSVTDVNVLDLIQPATLILSKVDAATRAPLAGAVLDTKFDPTHSGDYSVDLGQCTTSPAGECVPQSNDGSGFLPGSYRISEATPPPGYGVDTASAVQIVELSPGLTTSVTFADHALVGASFRKVATGDFDPAQVSYAGAVLQIHQTTPTGPVVSMCTTGLDGTCFTPANLISGSAYCWYEVQAPPGLAGGANGCFVASNGQAALPIVVSDPGLFVGVQAKKVDAASPSTSLEGAVLDLYRVDGGSGPSRPVSPGNAQPMVGQTWVGRATTGTDGVAHFALQFPGYAYCVLEVAAPANYQLNGAESCTPELAPTTLGTPSIATITEMDNESQVSLQATKFNSLTPGTAIPHAVYDLFVEGPPPPSGVLGAIPTSVRPIPGDTWFARATTDAEGHLLFQLPSGYAWCLREVSAPINYELDPAVHCTAVLTSSSPPADLALALPEVPALIKLSAIKYDSLEPNTVIAGAGYALFVKGLAPSGYDIPVAPATTVVPSGTTFWAQQVTDTAGNLTFSVPSGYAWCLAEVSAPAGYQKDEALHCTGVLSTSTSAVDASVALPELPLPTPITGLAYTGGLPLWFLGASLLVLGSGGLLVGLARRHGRHDDG